MAEVTIAHLTEAVQTEGAESERRDNKQIEQLASLNKSFAQYFKAQSADKLDKLEEAREKVSGPAPTRENFSDAAKGAKDALGFGLLGFLGIVTSAISGLATGIAVGLGKYLAALGRTFDNLTGNRIGKAITNLTRQIRGGVFRLIGLLPNGKLDPSASKFARFLRAVRSPFVSATGFFKTIQGGMFRLFGLGIDGKPVTTTSNFVKSILKFGNLFKPITSVFADSFKEVGSALKGIGNTVKSGIASTTRVFSTIGKTFSALRGALSPIFTVFKTLGRVIFAPLTLIISIIDGIKGAISGYQQEGVIGGILGAIGGVLSGLIGMPLDLVKSAIGFIAGKLGFENVQAALSGFSFADMIKDTFMGVARVFNDVLKNLFGGFENGFSECLSQMFKSMMVYVKRLLLFGPAVVAGGAAALGAVLPGGDSPIEAFQKTFSKVLTAGEGSSATTLPTEQGETGEEEIEPPVAAPQNVDRVVPQNEQVRSRRANIERMRANREANDARKAAMAVNTVNAPTTTNMSSNTAVFTDPTPATDDLDREAASF